METYERLSPPDSSPKQNEKQSAGASPCLPILCRAAVGLTLNPPSVSNTYSGTITLQVTGLTAGDTVVVQKFLDANTNGVIDGADLLVQQFDLTDGQASVIGGVTNFNVFHLMLFVSLQ